ncbi:transposase, partial [archaeon]|nr:transposase [archaeon]
QNGLFLHLRTGRSAEERGEGDCIIHAIGADTHKTLVSVTNDFSPCAYTVAQLYRCRWQIKLFFKWIKQHLGIKAFFGRCENAVKTQTWIADSVYVLIVIINFKKLNLLH